MNRDELLEQIRQGLKTGVIVQQDFLSLVQRGATTQANPETRPSRVLEILYYIGGFIVFIGVAILLGQHWRDLPTFMKLLVTLGSGFASYYAAIYLRQSDSESGISNALFFVSALLIPLGTGVAFQAADYPLTTPARQALAAGLLTAFYGVSHLAFGGQIFMLFTIIYTSWFYWSITTWLIGGSPLMKDLKLKHYCLLTMGSAYAFLGYAFSKNEKKPLSGALYGFASLLVLGAAFSLGGWKPNQSILWEAIFPGLTLGALFASVVLKSRATLILSSLFLIAYIGKITTEYFKDSIGWPFSLMVIGFGLIGIAYSAIHLNRKYWK